ncbi:MAG: DNA-binding transcriptional regulator, LysR family [Glaciihabitans sp.]|nr:DNA-binding transcriptional regulator, LysR family [Glaciihabitans sp.]
MASSSITLTQLRAFVEAAKAGSFTAAADTLEMTQPSISELVRKLEDNYELPLFVRGGRQLRLTAAGDELLVWARRIFDAVDGADQSMRDLRGLVSGTASFGVLRNASYYLLSDLAQRFHREYPGVQIRLIGQNSVEVAAAVRSGELEAGLAVLPINDEGLVVTPLLRDETLWASADGSRTTSPITIGQITEVPLVLYDAHYGWSDPTRRQLAERAAAAGVRLVPEIEVENVEAALELVARGVGETLVAGAVARGSGFPAGISTTPFAEPIFDTIALIRREKTTLSPVTQRLADMATEMLLGSNAEWASPGELPEGD